MTLKRIYGYNTVQGFNGNISDPKRKRHVGKSRGNKQTSYMEIKVLTITLLIVFVPETAAEMLK